MTEVKIPDVGGDTMKMVDLGHLITPIFFKNGKEIQDTCNNIPNYRFRKDDIMLSSFPKTGTNWTYEILMMIRNKSAERIKAFKLLTMLECTTAEEIDQQSSPRVINTHFPPKYLPLDDMKAKQIKTVLCIRNPKDTAVSYYNHMKAISKYEYEVEFLKYSDYLLGWQHILQEDTGFPLHIMYYEDMKMNGRKELERLLTFLDVQLDDKLKENIINMCGLDKMKADKEDKATFLRKGFSFFRKGQVGDWKNWFTVAQNEMFDNTWEKDARDLDLFKFKYT